MGPEGVQAKNPSLSDLSLSVQFIRGVGPERSRVLSRLGLLTAEDMLYLFPRRYEDRSCPVSISKLQGDQKQLIEGNVLGKRLIRLRGGQTLFRIVIEDKTGRCPAVWFNSPFLNKNFTAGQRAALYGNTERVGKGYQFVHPEYELIQRGRRVHTGRVVPFYPSTQDLPQKSLRSLQYEILLRFLPYLSDPLPLALQKRCKLVNKRYAMKMIHFPSNEASLRSAYERLVFEEFFMIQLAFARTRQRFALPKPTTLEDQKLKLDFEKLLSFELTPGQTKAMEEVAQDIKQQIPMHRLIQGEVGCGKTTVAAFALYTMARSGFQGALMVPTEVLAQQHYLTLTRLLAPAGIEVGLLTQGQKDKDKILGGLENGALKIVVGTQSLIQKTVKFQKLRIIIIDEQHKFGVLQRGFLREKSQHPHLLVMTATPIPRSLAMTLYGDLDLSVIGEIPKNRGCVNTLWLGENHREDAYVFIDQELAKGHQIFAVHPAIGPSEKIPLRDATRNVESLKKRFNHHVVELLHGRMEGQLKKEIMKRFSNNEIQVLVSTSVVEVGIDVPNATVLIVENAERFGLSQLHQMRGRIGRGHAESTCILFSETRQPNGMERLNVFTRMKSGFDIAEEDLRLRGPGDCFGLRQHGLPALRIGDPLHDLNILEAARKEAFSLIAKDTDLTEDAHRLLRIDLDQRFKKTSFAG
jgi:ATP-dependent DNA helicase RecG